MAWKYGDRTLRVGKGWTDNSGIKHPYNWMIWSDSYKTDTIGLTWEDDVDTSYDDRFYFAKDVVRILGDTLWVDDDGKAVNDELTGKQGVTAGLKTTWIAQAKSTANSLLLSSDWYIIRKAESNTAVPSAITTYRAAVKSSTADIETAINACDDLDDFKAMFVVPVDSDGEPTGKAPMYDYPDEV